MSHTTVDKIAHAVLYEGYILYPYRPSMKNRQRWTFGGIFPESCKLVRDGVEKATTRTQVLVRGDRQTRVRVKVRFLHPQTRTVGKVDPPVDALPTDAEPTYEAVESLTVDGKRYQTWEEAVEREVELASLEVGALVDGARRHDFAFAFHHEVEALREDGDAGGDAEGLRAGQVKGVLVREHQPLAGRVEVVAENVDDRLFRLSVTITNRTRWAGGVDADRTAATMHAFASTHALLEVAGGEFVSLMDPPDDCRDAAAACQNHGVWPVLVGEEGERDAMLASPIILYDHPKIAPESQGDHFDSTEIDEMLSLRIMTLTEEEKRQMGATDQRTKEMLERTETLAREQLMGLHGVMRDLKPGERRGDDAGDDDAGPATTDDWHQPWTPFKGLDAGDATVASGPGMASSPDPPTAFAPPSSDAPAADAMPSSNAPAANATPSSDAPAANAPADEPARRLSDLQQQEQQREVSSVRVGDHEYKPGDHVRLHPLGRADVFDIALAGMAATIETIMRDYEDRVHLVVTVDDDPGRDLGRAGKIAHRFFFGVEEVEPMELE